MFKTNEYFEGKVKSIAFNTVEGPARSVLWLHANMNSEHPQSNI